MEKKGIKNMKNQGIIDIQDASQIHLSICLKNKLEMLKALKNLAIVEFN